VLALIQMITAAEILLAPLWVGVMSVRPASSRALRWARLPAPMIFVAVILVGLGAMAEPSVVGEVLASQAVAVGFLILLAGMAAVAERAAGPRAAQGFTAVLGGLVLGSMILAGPAAELLSEPVRSMVVRAAMHVNPLVVAERTLGLDWMHQGLTYRLTPLGESFSYLFRDLAWWKTLLGHVFIGSGLLVFSLPRPQKDAAVPENRRANVPD